LIESEARFFFDEICFSDDIIMDSSTREVMMMMIKRSIFRANFYEILETLKEGIKEQQMVL